MADSDFLAIESQFFQALVDCRQLYHSAAEEFSHSAPTDGENPAERVLELMEDLHKGLLIKIYGCIAQADHRWTTEEERLAAILFEHVWGQRLSGERLRETALHVFDQSNRLKWYSLVRPFEQIPALRGRVDELETIVMRLANLVAKCDGVVTDGEAAFLRTIEDEIRIHLRPLDLADATEEAHGQAVAKAVQEIGKKTATPAATKANAGARPPADQRTPTQRLEEALAELNGLIGLDSVKKEVATLTNFLKLQTQRKAAGLPTTELSLHMVFTGNPGTGKTTVARIVGRIFGAMEILAQGHLIETDRSGLVAQYAGQTGPKTNKKIDEALEGVLFIDEAYSLVAEEGEDAYGREAIQVLLKRMEDDRHQLVLILAGYPQPMTGLLSSNPGLQSRFSTTLQFDDYQPAELGRIFQTLCDKNRYQAPGATQAKLMTGFRWLYDRRDERFGNGRTARNVFERAIRRLANRVAGIAPVTKELLTVIRPEDIEFPDVPAQILRQAEDASARFVVFCPGCNSRSAVPAAYFGRAVKCKTCNHRFTAFWGEPVDGT